MVRALRSNGRAGGSSTEEYGGSHAVAARRDFTAEVSLFSGADVGTFSAETSRRTTFAVETPYATAVRARIQALAARGRDVVQTADETVTIPGYLVEVDYGQDAKVGDTIVVDKCPDDKTLVDRRLRVDEVGKGSERFVRDLFCTLQTARVDATP